MRFLPSFLDTRMVHVPRTVAVKLFEEYLRKLGPLPQESAIPPLGCPLQHLAVSPRPALELFRQGKPKLIRYSIEEEAPSKTIIKMQVGYGSAFEWGLFGFMIVLGTWLNIVIAILLPLKNRMSPDDPLTFSVIFVLIVLLIGLWFLCFTWVWNRMGKYNTFPSQIYREISAKAGLQHIAINLPSLSWMGLVSLIIIVLGFATTVLLFALTKSFPRGLTIFAAVFTLAALCVCLLFIASRHRIERWNMGLASFSSTFSLSLYCLLPLLAAAFIMNDANQLFSNIQHGHKQFIAASLPALALVLVIVGSAFFPYRAMSAAKRIARNIDYCRSHPEVQIGARSGKSWLLTLAVLPMCLFTGVLATYSFLNCAVFLQSVLLGSHRWLVSPIFENAVTLFNILLGIFVSALGIKYAVFWPGKIALIIFSLPILAWGFSRVWLALKEIRQHFSFWQCCRNTPLEKNEKLKDTVSSVADFAHLSPPRVRIDPSNIIYAYVAIPPLPFLPRIMVLSEGTLTKLPWPSVQALVAHEIGHIKRGHTGIYTVLRFLSRILLLGPSFLTGLIKSPVELEAEADEFAIGWLETHGGSRQNLIDVIRATEEQKIVGLLQNVPRQSMGVAKWDSGDWLPADLRADLNQEAEQSFFRGMRTQWKLLQYMTMNSDLATYLYLPFSERIRRIRAWQAGNVTP
jgi:Zn-dependent protease with chaperone function